MFYPPNLILLFAGILAFTLNACAFAPDENANKNKYERFNNLLELNDLSERSFIYYEYCRKNDGSIDKTFMRNFEVTSDLLLNEAVKTMEAPPQLIVGRVLGRRKVIQQQLSDYYHSQGCQSDEARTAASHYDAFSKMTEKQVKNLVE